MGRLDEKEKEEIKYNKHITHTTRSWNWQNLWCNCDDRDAYKLMHSQNLQAEIFLSSNHLANCAHLDEPLNQSTFFFIRLEKITRARNSSEICNCNESFNDCLIHGPTIKEIIVVIVIVAINASQLILRYCRNKQWSKTTSKKKKKKS